MFKKLIVIILSISIFSCKKPESELTVHLNSDYEEGEELLGGNTTVFNESSNAFSLELATLNVDGHHRFIRGNSFFSNNWVTAPSSTTSRDGLGPLFNAASCSGCHFKDGRGTPPEYPGDKLVSMLIRLSISGSTEHGGPLPEPNYGGQFNDRAILGVDPEGDVAISYTEISGKYPDGTTYSLRKPIYSFNNLKYGALASGVLFSPRVAPQMIGLGLLEAISEQTILSYSDPLDQNNDGISGKANYVWDFKNQKTALGRFGWKANQPNLFQQSAGAFLGDIGITSNLFSVENLTGVQLSKWNMIPNGGTPEINDTTLADVIFYSSTLAVPARRNAKNEEVLLGKKIFSNIGCTSCHIPKVMTSTHKTIPELSNQIIRPYTDLLLHDMGEDLSDNRPDFLAEGFEWRTPPLWGIGLFNVVNSHTNYLHDGRARSLEEAILWHGGESANSRDKFKKLDKKDRDRLIAFLKTL